MSVHMQPAPTPRTGHRLTLIERFTRWRRRLRRGNPALIPPACRDCAHCHHDRMLTLDRCTRGDHSRWCDVERADGRVFAWMHGSCGRGARHFEAREVQG